MCPRNLPIFCVAGISDETHISHTLTARLKKLHVPWTAKHSLHALSVCNSLTSGSRKVFVVSFGCEGPGKMPTTMFSSLYLLWRGWLSRTSTTSLSYFLETRKKTERCVGKRKEWQTKLTSYPDVVTWIKPGRGDTSYQAIGMEGGGSVTVLVQMLDSMEI